MEGSFRASWASSKWGLMWFIKFMRTDTEHSHTRGARASWALLAFSRRLELWYSKNRITPRKPEHHRMDSWAAENKLFYKQKVQPLTGSSGDFLLCVTSSCWIPQPSLSLRTPQPVRKMLRAAAPVSSPTLLRVSF